MDKLVCCPLIKVEDWDDKIHQWTGKQFVKGYIKSFFGIPCNIGKVMASIGSKIRAVGANSPDYVCLFDKKTKFKIDVMVEVTKEVPNMENVTISGKFYSKVYEGSYCKIGEWKRDFKNIMKKKMLEQGKVYLWYTSCPQCAKRNGKNYIVLIAECKKKSVSFVV